MRRAGSNRRRRLAHSLRCGLARLVVVSRLNKNAGRCVQQPRHGSQKVTQ